MPKRRWKDLSGEEQSKAVLGACSRGRTSRAIVEFLDAPAPHVEDILVDLRKAGLVRCTDKHWYRADLPLRAHQPKEPRLTEKQLKALARQGRLF